MKFLICAFLLLGLLFNTSVAVEHQTTGFRTIASDQEPTDVGFIKSLTNKYTQWRDRRDKVKELVKQQEIKQSQLTAEEL